MLTVQPRRKADTLLAACVFGMAMAPLPLLVLGISEWSSPFGLMASGLVLLACAALVFRYVIRRTDTAGLRTGGGLLEVASWAVVLAFLVVGSGIKLLVGIERVGLVADSFLLLTILGLPITILRRTAIERRLTRLPRAGVAVVTVLTLVAAGLVALIDLSIPARFPGGRKSRHADDPVGSLDAGPRRPRSADDARAPVDDDHFDTKVCLTIQPVSPSDAVPSIGEKPTSVGNGPRARRTGQKKTAELSELGCQFDQCWDGGLPATAATAAAAVAAASTTTATAASATAATRALLSLIHGQRAALKLPGVEVADRFGGFRIGRHLDEAESPRTTGVAVHDQLGLGHGAGLREEVAQVHFGGVEGEVTNVQSLAH